MAHRRQMCHEMWNNNRLLVFCCYKTTDLLCEGTQSPSFKASLTSIDQIGYGSSVKRALVYRL